jgi:hypothetical protein
MLGTSCANCINKSPDISILQWIFLLSCFWNVILHRSSTLPEEKGQQNRIRWIVLMSSGKCTIHTPEDGFSFWMTQNRRKSKVCCLFVWKRCSLLISSWIVSLEVIFVHFLRFTFDITSVRWDPFVKLASWNVVCEMYWFSSRNQEWFCDNRFQRKNAIMMESRTHSSCDPHRDALSTSYLDFHKS